MNLTAHHITDEFTTCECCGKTGLKATVAMLSDDGGLFHFGRTCAARNSGKSSQGIKRDLAEAKRADFGRCTNHLMALRRQGVKPTKALITELQQAHPAADLQLLLRQWL